MCLACDGDRRRNWSVNFNVFLESVALIIYVSAENRGNAALSLGDLLQKNRGKCCPFFMQELYATVLTLHFLLRTGENAAHFSARLFFAVFWSFYFIKNQEKLCIFLRECSAVFGFCNFSVKKRGKCCPFFCEKILQCFDASKFWRKCCPFCSESSLQSCWCFNCSVHNRGKRCPFFAIVFYSVFRSLINSLTLEEMLPVFLRTLFAVFWIFISSWKQEEMLPIFLLALLEAFQFSIFCLKSKRRNAGFARMLGRDWSWIAEWIGLGLGPVASRQLESLVNGCVARVTNRGSK